MGRSGWSLGGAAVAAGLALLVAYTYFQGPAPVSEPPKLTPAVPAARQPPEDPAPVTAVKATSPLKVVYRCRKNGVLVFADSPCGNDAVKVELSSPNTVEPFRPPKKRAPSKNGG